MLTIFSLGCHEFFKQVRQQVKN